MDYISNLPKDTIINISQHLSSAIDLLNFCLSHVDVIPDILYNVKVLISDHLVYLDIKYFSSSLEYVSSHVMLNVGSPEDMKYVARIYKPKFINLYLNYKLNNEIDSMDAIDIFLEHRKKYITYKILFRVIPVEPSVPDIIFGYIFDTNRVSVFNFNQSIGYAPEYGLMKNNDENFVDSKSVWAAELKCSILGSKVIIYDNEKSSLVCSTGSLTPVILADVEVSDDMYIILRSPIVDEIYLISPAVRKLLKSIREIPINLNIFDKALITKVLCIYIDKKSLRLPENKVKLNKMLLESMGNPDDKMIEEFKLDSLPQIITFVCSIHYPVLKSNISDILSSTLTPFNILMSCDIDSNFQTELLQGCNLKS